MSATFPAAMGAPSNVTVPVLAACRAHDAFEQCGLARPIVAEYADASAPLQLQRDAA